MITLISKIRRSSSLLQIYCECLAALFHCSCAPTDSSHRDRDVYLALRDLRKLDTAIITYYRQWVDEAPAKYKEDGWLLGNVPITITSRYGQDQDLGLEEDSYEEAAQNWNQDHNFTPVRYMTIALATHIQ